MLRALGFSGCALWSRRRGEVGTPVPIWMASKSLNTLSFQSIIDIAWIVRTLIVTLLSIDMPVLEGIVIGGNCSSEH